MKYLRKYEELNKDKPKIGDYVIVNYDDHVNFAEQIDFNNFIRNRIGKIIDIIYKRPTHSTYTDPPYYIVKYNISESEHVSKSILSWFEKDSISIRYRKYTRSFSLEDIKYWSKNIKELEPIIAANKFNL